MKLERVFFPLHPDTPADGMTLDELFAGRLNIAATMARLKSVAEELGLPFGHRTRTFNSRRAQELGKWAIDQGRGEAFHQAVYMAYFVEGSNISRTEILLQIAASAGLPGHEAELALADPTWSAAVDADWKKSRRQGIQAVPCCSYQGRFLVGFQPYQAYQKLITS